MDLGPKVPSPMSPEAWSEIHGLSEHLINTAGGRFRLMAEASENQEDRASLYLPCAKFDTGVVDSLSAGLEDKYKPGRYEEMAAEMRRGGREIIINRTAAELEDKKTVVINMNHASLIRSGIGFRLISKALEEKGVSFDTAIIGGAALMDVEVRLDSDSEDDDDAGFIPAYDAIGLISDHLFVSVPATDRAKKLRTKHGAEVSAHNEQMKEKLRELLDGDEGVLLMMLGSGTHDKKIRDNPTLIQMEPISKGTVDFIVENKLDVVQAAVADLPDKPMGFYLLSGPAKIVSAEQMHVDMARTARFLSRQAIHTFYEYKLPS